MFRFCFLALTLCLCFSCAREGSNTAVSAEKPDNVSPAAALPAPSPGIPPLAVLKAGKYPIWFQVSGDGPVLLESIDDARFSAALVPWPLAPHISFMLAGKNELLAVLNRGGFVRLALENSGGVQNKITHNTRQAAGTGLYYFSGGEFWQQYTVGAFFFLGEQPAALLYRDDLFLDSTVSLPSPRFWTLNRFSAAPQAISIPALEPFPADEGWDADTLRLGPDGLWYFRLVKKDTARPEIRMFRAESLAGQGTNVSLGDFQNSAKPEPLSAAPAPLRALLSEAFGTGGGTATALSPEFSRQRHFTGTGRGTAAALAAFWEPAESGTDRPTALAVQPDGRGLYTTTMDISNQTEQQFKSFTLPPLPEGFVYTGIGFAGYTLFAAWEEQEEYSIGAAGFMVLSPEW